MPSPPLATERHLHLAVRWMMLTFLMIPSETILVRHDHMLGVVFNHSTFITWNPEPSTWLEAKRLCKRKHGNLVSLKTEDVNVFVFESFFQQDILKTPPAKRKNEFSSERRKPPTREGVSKEFHKYEAWVNGYKAIKKNGRSQWVWLGYNQNHIKFSAVLFRFSHFGTGFTNETFWNCLSVGPGYEGGYFELIYGLFWHGSDCRTRLPYICQYPVARSVAEWIFVPVKSRGTSVAMSFRQHQQQQTPAVESRVIYLSTISFLTYQMIICNMV